MRPAIYIHKHGLTVESAAAADCSKPCTVSRNTCNKQQKEQIGLRCWDGLKVKTKFIWNEIVIIKNWLIENFPLMSLKKLFVIIEKKCVQLKRRFDWQSVNY